MYWMTWEIEPLIGQIDVVAIDITSFINYMRYNQNMNILTAIETLSHKRKVFHSEADFQFALAWEIHEQNPDSQVRLEYSPAGITPVVHIDICVLLNNEVIPIELKYLKKKLKFQENDEQFDLRDNGAQDISRYDFLKDVQRIEHFRQTLPGIKQGYVILLTNDPVYWKTGNNNNNTIDSSFRIEEGKFITGKLAWSEHAGPGTMKGREKPIEIEGCYPVQWHDFSFVNSSSAGTFRYLIIDV
jgi:hypothetical protein